MTTIRRQVKNVIKNYSEAEVKVREATSNDPWGPSSTLMNEISDLTYNIVALSEIMRMIWKRLNDHGKNWRHVYKSLVLLDYLIKNGNEKVVQQCKEHIVTIQTLKDFQYMEENKDQGANVRDKAKNLVALIRDDDRFKQERQKALKARERYAQNAMGISSDNKITYGTSGNPGRYSGTSTKTGGNYSDPYGVNTHERLGSAGDASLSADLEAVRPSDVGEEDLQVQLAIMLSEQEHAEDVKRKRADEAKLQLALEQSKMENGMRESAGDVQPKSVRIPSKNAADEISYFCNCFLVARLGVRWI
jgi:epsin